MKPDVIVCWPQNCDYPLWRQFIRDNRSRFAKVIVVFTPHDGGDFREFVKEAMTPDDITFLVVTYLASGEDWRDAAVNAALDASSAQWVWFTEQDFIITDPVYWDVLAFLARLGYEGMGWHEHGEARFHPSSLFVRRNRVNETSRNFGVTATGDHFAAFCDELKGCFDMTPGNGRAFEHLQGLSQNHFLVDRGEIDGRFHEDRFRQYIADCLEVSVPLNSDWAERSHRYLRAQAA